MMPFSTNRTIPSRMTVEVVRAVIAAELLFGAEVYGMCRRMTDPMQTHFNRVCRMALGNPAKAPASNVALWRQTRIPPKCEGAAARRARAMAKDKF